MCISPIKIKSNKICYRPGIDKDFYSVPCGHCYECVQRICNEWFVRISALYKEWKGKELPVFFLTLSYNNDERPFFSDSIPQIERNNSKIFPVLMDDLPCFNRRHLTQFFKDLRKLLGDGLKFFLVCEYGTDVNGKHLPHYHVILFSPLPISNYEFLDKCEYAWSHKVKKSYTPSFVQSLSKNPSVLSIINDRGYFRYNNKLDNKIYFITKQGSVYRYFVCRGYCMFSSDHGAQLASLSGVKYVLKYLHKETLSLSPSYANVVRLKKWYSKTSADDESIKRLRECVRWSLPFHMQSRGIGLSLLDDLKAMSFDELVRVKRDGLQVADGTKKLYSIPTYILRKLFYNKEYLFPHDERPVYYLNELGCKVTKVCFEDMLKRQTAVYDFICSPEFLKLIPNVDKYVSDLGFDLKIIISKYQYISCVHKDMLPMYNVVFKDVSTYFINADKYVDNSYDLLYDLGKNLFFFKTDYYFVNTYDDKLVADFHGIFLKDSLEYPGIPKNSYATFNECPAFDGWDDILFVFQRLYERVSELIADGSIDTDRLKKYVRDMLNF